MAVAIVMMVVVIPSAALWAGGGGLLGRLSAGRRIPRIVNLALAALLVATVVYVWV